MSSSASGRPREQEPRRSRTPARSPQACGQCRQIKKRCPRNLPSCSSCTRLGKTCQYPAGRKRHASPEERDVQSLAPSFVPSVSTTSSVVDDNFPDAFFIDNDLHKPISHATEGEPFSVPAYFTTMAGQPDAVYEMYFDSVDTWLPFINRKRLKQDLEAESPSEATEMTGLLLSMKLITNNDLEDEPSEELGLYDEVKGYLQRNEIIMATTLRYFQSIVLLGLYEISHGIYPEAYLTIGQAARLGLLRGIQDRKHATQLFQEPPTWTYWEEERRTWWATSILERYININLVGFPLATPEPAQGDLLPSSDEVWRRGETGTNPPLCMTGFATGSEVGPFARVCQASYILGRVLNHRNSRKDLMSQEARLSEALYLDATLTALDTHLSPPRKKRKDTMRTATLDVALCTSARLILYRMYACTQSDATSDRLPAEIEMQTASIRGLKQIVSTRGTDLALCAFRQGMKDVNRLSPLLVQCLYDIAIEWQGFKRKGDIIEGMEKTMTMITGTLALLSLRWGVAIKSQKFLKNAQD
ncbi:fungal specific transcription factor [Colletotrichum incanum]|uniref:Fungal specific transcription factor n=1 Tax=Colletotrichum incanum TaxID=1573173 RepID=A0A161XS77_COLIC|nr:fungal specific transcription factor [Colletotrichum incanum]